MQPRSLLKPAAFAAALAPVVYTGWTALNGQLGLDPYRAITRDTGTWTLWFLCLGLVLTPLRRLTSAQWLVKFRRMLGLFAFFYGTIHALTYVVFDRLAAVDVPQGLASWAAAVELARSAGSDVVKRPFLGIGLVGFLIMVPLAATSTPGMIRLLGGRKWQRLHRLVYVAAIAGLLHHWWPIADRFRLDIYGVLIGTSIAFRIYWSNRRTRPPSPAVARPFGPQVGPGRPIHSPGATRDSLR